LAVRDAAARPDARRGRGGAAGGDRVAQDGGRAGGGTRTREESGRGEFRLAPGFRALARLEPGALRADGVVAPGGSVRAGAPGGDGGGQPGGGADLLPGGAEEHGGPAPRGGGAGSEGRAPSSRTGALVPRSATTGGGRGHSWWDPPRERMLVRCAL